MPWASRAIKDAVGPGSFERKLNKLTDAGWEIVSFHTAPEGNFFLWARVMATVVLRRTKTVRTVIPVA